MVCGRSEGGEENGGTHKVSDGGNVENVRNNKGVAQFWQSAE